MKIKVLGIGNEGIKCVNNINKEEITNTSIPDFLIIVCDINNWTIRKVNNVLETVKKENTFTILVGKEVNRYINVDSKVIASDENTKLITVNSLISLLKEEKSSNDTRDILKNNILIAEIGIGKRKERVSKSVEMIFNSSDIKKIKDNTSNILVSIIGDDSLNLIEAEEVCANIRNNLKRDVNTIYIVSVNKNLTDEIIVNIIATKNS